ncbi:uncharacterized protein LOC123562192 [Mercenaria mercenaria]|uniref:uncharacterized protein LOC123562192 n=1 Tax=Mercenaria mercenaria TaxID=6596 RepID=UPI00234EA71B|nr:uncharacterized protein LOC123562192 [Mercenaria mercenaria]
MPEDNQDVESPEDTDVVAIIRMMSNCRLFMTLDDYDVREIIDGLDHLYFGDSLYRQAVFDLMAAFLHNLIQDIHDDTIRDNLKRVALKIETIAAQLQIAARPPDLNTTWTPIRAIGRSLKCVLGIVARNLRLILYGFGHLNVALRCLCCRVVRVVDFKPVTPHRCGFETSFEA